VAAVGRKYVAAFVAGGITAALGVWLNAEVRAQSSAGAMLVCAGADGVLHVAEVAPTCKPGETSLYLFPQAQSPQRDESDTSQSASRQRKLADLERQAANLERVNPHSAATTVAPFNVVDRNGKTVFSVTNDDAYGTYAQLFNNEGYSSVTFMAFDKGGLLRAASPKGPALELKAMDPKELGLYIVDGSGKSVELGRDPDAGTYRLRFVGKRGLVAGIGQSKLAGNPPLAYVADAGAIKARMYITQDTHRGKFSVSKDGINEIAVLSEGSSGGGVLTLYNSSGETPMVDAGAAAGGFGLVRAGPGAFKPGYGVLGLPGSYISGKPQ
jgi:hypothetical protein